MRIQEQTKHAVKKLLLASEGAPKGERREFSFKIHTMLFSLMKYNKSIRNRSELYRLIKT